jgi:tetratricopeptide (TPR) repeat protein
MSGVVLLRRILLTGLVCGSVFLGAALGLAQSAVTLRERGIAARDRGDLTGAIAQLRQAAKLEPRNLTGLISLGWTLHLARQDGEAAAVLERTLWIDPYHAPTFNALGIVYLKNNDLLRSVLAHRWAAAIQADNEIAHYNLSLAYQRLKQYDQAIAEAKTAIRLEPNNPHPLLALAITYRSKGDREEARQVFQQAIEMNPLYASRDGLNYLADAGFSVGQIVQTGLLLEEIR